MEFIKPSFKKCILCLILISLSFIMFLLFFGIGMGGVTPGVDVEVLLIYKVAYVAYAIFFALHLPLMTLARLYPLRLVILIDLLWLYCLSCAMVKAYDKISSIRNPCAKRAMIRKPQ